MVSKLPSTRCVSKASSEGDLSDVNGQALVRKGDKFYFINKQGKWVKDLENPEENEMREMKQKKEIK